MRVSLLDVFMTPEGGRDGGKMSLEKVRRPEDEFALTLGSDVVVGICGRKCCC